MTAQGGLHGGPLAAIDLLDLLQMGVEGVIGQEAVQHLLAEGVAVQIRGLLGDGHLLAQPVRYQHPAQTERGHHRLGEGAEQHGIVRRQLGDGGKMFPLEAQLAIRVVFHHQQIVAHQALGQGFTVGAAVRDPARVLEVRHAVQQPGAGTLLQQRIQRGQIQSLFPEGDGLEVRLIDGERLDGTQVARLFDDQILPLVHQHLAQQIQRLLGAAGDEDVVRVDLHAVAAQVAVGDVLAQRGEPFGSGVLQRRGALLVQHVLAGLLDGLDREQMRIGQAAGEGDDLRIGGDFEDFTDKRRLDLLEALGKKRLHRVLSD